MPASRQGDARVDTGRRSGPSSRSASALHRLMWSPAWDVAMRVVGCTWTGLLLLASLANLLAFVGTRQSLGMSSLAFATAVAARLAFATFLAVLIFFYVARLEPRAKASGLGARVVALGGAFLPTALALLPRYDGSALLNLASFACIAGGNLLSVYAMVYLSRSASIMAEARRLVTSGPYRLVRHPVYLFEEIAVVGVVLGFLSPPRVAALALLILVVHLWCQFRRMANEERVLEATFPDHAQYRQRTARLVPGVY